MNNDVLTKLLVILRKLQNIQASAFGKVSMDVYYHYSKVGCSIEVRIEDKQFDFFSNDSSAEIDFEYMQLKKFFKNYE